MTVSERGQLARDLDQQLFFQRDRILQRRKVRQPRRAEDWRHNLTGRTEIAARLQVAPRFSDAGLPFRPVRVQPVKCRLAANRGDTHGAVAKRGLVFADTLIEARTTLDLHPFNPKRLGAVELLVQRFTRQKVFLN